MKTKQETEKFRKAKEVVFRLLKFRLRSEQEVRERLRQKQVDIDIINKTVQYFKDIQLIDDQEFAKKWISSRLARPFGVNRIRFELKLKGINDQILTDELSQISEDYSEFEVVMELAKDRMAKYHRLDEEKRKQRVYGYLKRRGFNSNVIIKAINELK